MMLPRFAFRYSFLSRIFVDGGRVAAHCVQGNGIQRELDAEHVGNLAGGQQPVELLTVIVCAGARSS
jgi:hypothetical protein